MLSKAHAMLTASVLTACMLFCCASSTEEIKREQGAVNEYCLSETFQPRCQRNEVILVTSATYGRMRIGRCITAEEVAEQRSLAGDVPRILGCSADVLDTLARACSGKRECEVRVIEMSHGKVKPCFPGLSVYLDASYDCISVADEDGSCIVTASMDPTHLIGPSPSPSTTRCGTMHRPWIIRAPLGQKISIVVLDFAASGLNSGHHDGPLSPCQRQIGIVVDAAGKRNASICEPGSAEKLLYLSAANTVEIYFSQSQQQTERNSENKDILLKVNAVGCTDIIPPEDTWLKRKDDLIAIGCYSSRQTWHLTCKEGRWTGVLGNCSQGSTGRESVAELQLTSTMSKNGQVLAMVAIGGFTLAVCLTVICIGIICLRRFNAKRKKLTDYRTLNLRNNGTESQNTPANGLTASDKHDGDFISQQMPTYSVYIGQGGYSGCVETSPGVDSSEFSSRS